MTPAGMGGVAAPPQELERQLEQHRRELVAYSYRMLGSAFEAEDAVQETMVRAWRGHDRFEGAVVAAVVALPDRHNVCLDMLDGRNRRARPMELGPAGSRRGAAGRRLPETVWLQPMPDARVLHRDADPAELAVRARVDPARVRGRAAAPAAPPAGRADPARGAALAGGRGGRAARDERRLGEQRAAAGPGHAGRQRA